MRARTTFFAVLATLITLTAIAADTQPPTLSIPTADPNVLSPANDELVPVKVSVEAKDNEDPNPRCAIRNVWSDLPISSDDWRITGDFEVLLRAKASPGQDRIYNVVVVCSDKSGNEAGNAATVRVLAPPDKSDKPPEFVRLAASPDVLTPPNNELVSVKIDAQVVDDNDPQPRCGVRSVWSEQAITENDWKITGQFEVQLRATAVDLDRLYNVVVICTDSAGNEAGGTATVRVPVAPSKADKPPVLTRIAASPDILSPANGELVPVKVDVSVTDDRDPNPRCAVRNVWSEQSISSDDWKVTGQFEVELRAETTKDGRDRVYNVVVVCTDSAGNEAGGSASVRVLAAQPKEDRPPVLVKLTASPDTLTPANDELVPVKVDVEVVDDNDPQPRCSIRSVWSEQAITTDDWKIAGDLEVALRATAKDGQNRVYHVVVVCTDSALNEAGDSVAVTVPASQNSPDVLPPIVMKLLAASTTLAPNDELVPVKLNIEVVDDTDPFPTCAIGSVWSNQPLAAGDWKLIGPLEIALRASTTGGQDRVYSITVICSDFSANTTSDVATIRVPVVANEPVTSPPPTKRRSSRS